MADWRSMRKHEVFLSLKRDLALVVQATHNAEEIVISSHKAMKEEEGKCVAVVKAFELAKKKSQYLNAKLVEADRDKKSAEAALDMAKRQAEAQRKQLCQAEDELSVAKIQIKVLTKKLEEVEKAKKQDDYDVGVVEIEETLRVEVSKVCKFYCLQVWNEALD
ncbi:uncharacterized protein LOC112015237 [Quercus suber]|uniref:uncharacterized protein LOC112015237 n=1 Tax=Quercus suber TaxID=58331 RepID=UPI000CE1928C|nr:uncharacterized protein LOC112015237 [Quercus suber]